MKKNNKVKIIERESDNQRWALAPQKPVLVTSEDRRALAALAPGDHEIMFHDSEVREVYGVRPSAYRPENCIMDTFLGYGRVLPAPRPPK